MRHLLTLCLLLLAAGPATAMSGDTLKARGFSPLSCLFTERCLIGMPCERAWREMRWYLSDAEGIAYRAHDDGKFQKGQLLSDARWGNLSEARQIVMPMREAVASNLTVFDGGGAVYSLQYAANPGSGQFYLGACNRGEG